MVTGRVLAIAGAIFVAIVTTPSVRATAESTASRGVMSLFPPPPAAFARQDAKPLANRGVAVSTDRNASSDSATILVRVARGTSAITLPRTSPLFLFKQLSDYIFWLAAGGGNTTDVSSDDHRPPMRHPSSLSRRGGAMQANLLKQGLASALHFFVITKGPLLTDLLPDHERLPQAIGKVISSYGFSSSLKKAVSRVLRSVLSPAAVLLDQTERIWALQWIWSEATRDWRCVMRLACDDPARGRRYARAGRYFIATVDALTTFRLLKPKVNTFLLQDTKFRRMVEEFERAVQLGETPPTACSDSYACDNI